MITRADAKAEAQMKATQKATRLALAIPKEGQSTYFMDLAPELRVMIYDYIFSSAHRRFTADVGTPDQPEKEYYNHIPSFVTSRRRSPCTCSGVPTSILRVNRQIHCEALPVLWENIEFAHAIPYGPTATSFDEHETMHSSFDDDIESKLRSKVSRIVISFPRVQAGQALCPTMSLSLKLNLEYFCGQVRKHRPKLREVRIYVDRWAWPVHNEYNMHPLVRVAETVMRSLDDIVLYVNVHAPLENGPEGDLDDAPDVKARHAEAIEALRNTAERWGRNISVEPWGARRALV